MKSPLRVIAGKKLLCQAHGVAFLPRIVILPMLGCCGPTIAQYQRSKPPLRPERLTHCGICTSLRMLFVALFFLAVPQRSFAGALTWPSDGEVLSLGASPRIPRGPNGTLELRCSDRRRCLDSLAQDTWLWLYLGCLLVSNRPANDHTGCIIGFPSHWLSVARSSRFFELDASSSSPIGPSAWAIGNHSMNTSHSHRHFYSM